ncbi:MAG: hypothetical protein EAY75_11465 [Bacteroidetes bacterium]|nr:MAG: hypothetical protein EAY75_11465 [Bacteroidota bacterium]
MLLRIHEPLACRQAIEAERQQLQNVQMTLQAELSHMSNSLQNVQRRYDAVEMERNLLGNQLAAQVQLCKGLQAQFEQLAAPLKQGLADLKLRLEGAIHQASAERNTMLGRVREVLLQTNALS